MPLIDRMKKSILLYSSI